MGSKQNFLLTNRAFGSLYEQKRQPARLRKGKHLMRTDLQRILVPVLVTATLLFGAGPGLAQTKASAPSRPVASNIPMTTEKDTAAVQEQLIKLLRLSPTLTTVVARDPSLLANQEYVQRNNPQLAQFLASHPEVGLNPDFYLFTRMQDENGRTSEALERAVWPELVPERRDSPLAERLLGDSGPVLVFIIVTGALLWLVRLFVDNRRWGRIFKLQTEVHGKLIDKFGTNEELLVYMNTDAGKRFLEAAPIPVNFEQSQPVPSAVARVLTPLQIGIVLSLLGGGLLSLRHASVDMDIPMLFLGTLILMPGLGFILSSGVTWLLAGRLGLIPDANANGSQDFRGRQ